MGYGKIYETTWWGNTTNNISWGSAYANIVFSPLQLSFKDRVEADNGIVESLSCVKI